MPRSPQQHYVASLKALMRSGTLWPLNVSMTMLDVSPLLGPPGDWLMEAGHCPVPYYWSYGALEIAFQPHVPYAVDWFQIEHPTALARPRDDVAGRLLLSMDRIDLSAPPSRMLRHLRDLPNVVVATPKDADWKTLEIHIGGVCLTYVLADSLMPVDGIDPNALLRRFDESCQLDSIYSFRQPALEFQSPKGKYRNLSAEQYLAAVGRRPRPDVPGAS